MVTPTAQGTTGNPRGDVTSKGKNFASAGLLFKADYFFAGATTITPKTLININLVRHLIFAWSKFCFLLLYARGQKVSCLQIKLYSHFLSFVAHGLYFDVSETSTPNAKKWIFSRKGLYCGGGPSSLLFVLHHHERFLKLSVLLRIPCLWNNYYFLL